MRININHFDGTTEEWVITDRGATSPRETYISGDEVHSFSVRGNHPGAPTVRRFQFDRVSGRHALAARALMSIRRAHQEGT